MSFGLRLARICFDRRTACRPLAYVSDNAAVMWLICVLQCLQAVPQVREAIEHLHWRRSLNMDDLSEGGGHFVNLQTTILTPQHSPQSRRPLRSCRTCSGWSKATGLPTSRSTSLCFLTATLIGRMEWACMRGVKVGRTMYTESSHAKLRSLARCRSSDRCIMACHGKPPNSDTDRGRKSYRPRNTVRRVSAAS